MKTKKCSHCLATKPVTEFVFKNKQRGLLQSWCNTCERDYKQDWYLRNRQRHMENVHAQRLKVRMANRRLLLDYLLTHPCVDCGEGNLVVLDFDHVKAKRWSIAMMVNRGFPWATIEDEITRCQVRCANCHRIKTARERGYYDLKFNGQLFESPGAYRIAG